MSDQSPAPGRAEARVDRLIAHAIFEGAAFGIVEVGLDGRILEVNRACWEQLGYARGELIGRPFADLVHPDDLAGARDALEVLTRGERASLRTERRYRRKDGTIGWAALTGERVEAAGRPPSILVMAEEITGRKRHEALVEGEKAILEQIARGAELQDALEAIVALVESVSDGMLGSILLVDDTGHVHVGAGQSLPAAYNAAIEGEPIGPAAGSCGTAAWRKETVITPDIATDPLWASYREVALRAGLASSWSTPLFSSDGRVVGTLAQYYRKPQDPSPRDLQLVAIARHLAEIAIARKQSDEQLIAARDELREASDRRARLLADQERAASARREAAALAKAQAAQELDRLKTLFIHTISHELRNPLTSLVGYLELLDRDAAGPLSPRQHEFVAHALHGTHRIQHLIDDLVDYARVEGGVFRIRPQRADVVAIVREVVADLKPETDAAGVRLSVIAPGDPVPADVDARRVAQVLSNLLSNAIKFSPRGGTVCLRVEVRDPCVSFEVSDEGPGIAWADRPKLFHLFTQLEGGLRKGGTGLGLAIAKRIVQAHGGEIGLRERARSGTTTFYVTLPRFRKPEAEVSSHV